MAAQRRKRLPPIRPGEVLADALDEGGLTANHLAMQLSVPANRITAIVKGQRSISVDTAMRLGR